MVPARAGLIGGVAGTVGGVVGGTIHSVGSTVGGAAGGVLSGPSSTLAGGPSGSAASFGSGIGGLGSQQPSLDTQNIPRASGPIRAAIAEMMRQRVSGRLDAMSGTSARLTTANGTRTLAVSGPIAAALRTYVGKNVELRTLDGTHAVEFVGRADVVRGTVTSVDGNFVGFMSPTGLTSVIGLAPGDASKLRVGERVAATSSDFGRSVRLTTLGTAPASTLADVYVGRVMATTSKTATVSIDSRSQTFGVDPAMAAALRARVGKVVALDVPDGANAKALVAMPTLTRLIAGGSSGQSTGTVVAATRSRLAVQLPNGDTRTLTGPVASLDTRVGSNVRLAPLDRVHVRVTAGAKAARLADANACVTVNATCSTSMSGRAVAVTPTSLSVRLANGDVRTFLGTVPSIPAGAPVSVTPVDGKHARVTAGGHAANLLNADACITINAGCHATVGSIQATGNGRTVVMLPDGSQTVVNGALTNASVDSPILMQPLDNSHMVAMTGGSIGTVAVAGACVTLNASCRSARINPVGVPPSGGGPGNPGNPGNPTGPGSPTGPGTIGGPGGAPVLNGTVSTGAPEMLALAFSPNTCGNDGELIARAGDARTGRVLAGTRVHIWGAFEATVTTGSDGRATIGRLPVGSYTASFSRAGYRATAPVAVTIGCTTAAVLDGRLAPLAMRSVSTARRASDQPRLDKAAARKAVVSSTFCVRHGVGLACGKKP